MYFHMNVHSHSRIFKNKSELSNFKKETISCKLFISRFIKNTAMIQLYTGYERNIVAPVISLQEIEKINIDYKTAGLLLRIDQLNDRYFPTFGYFLETEFRYNINKNNIGYFSSGKFKWNLFWNWHTNHVFFHKIHSGTSFSSPLSEPVYFPVGGYNSFMGYKNGELLVRHYVFEVFGYRYKINSYLYWESFIQGLKSMKDDWSWNPNIREFDNAIGTSLRLKLFFSQFNLTFTHSTYRDFLIWFEFGYKLDFPF